MSHDPRHTFALPNSNATTLNPVRAEVPDNLSTPNHSNPLLFSSSQLNRYSG
jgi:hypothetical protein